MIINQKLYADFFELIKKHDNFLVVTHVNPDGDTIGSALGIAQILKQQDKKFLLINEEPLPEKFLFLPMASEFTTPDCIQEPFENIIMVDCADYQRIGNNVIKKLETMSSSIINIDHHPTNNNYGALNIVDPDAASTTFIIYNLCKEIGVQFNYDLAICLYTGLMTDTGSFKYSNTTSKVHLVASELIDFGIEVYDIVDKIFETNTMEKLIVLKDSLETIEIDSTGKVSWLEIVTTRSTNSDISDAEGLVNYPRSIEGVEVAISFKVINDNEVKVGLRSKKYVDVGLIASYFNGGGHKRAAGCTVHEPLIIVKEKVLNEVQKYL